MNWKLEIVRLRDVARPVRIPTHAVGMGAREAARVLSGIVSVIARQHGVEAMQAACAELVLDPSALATGFVAVPRGAAHEMLAVVCRGLLASTSLEHVKAALAFWASETDHAEWQSVAA